MGISQEQTPSVHRSLRISSVGGEGSDPPGLGTVLALALFSLMVPAPASASALASGVKAASAAANAVEPAQFRRRPTFPSEVEEAVATAKVPKALVDPAGLRPHSRDKGTNKVTGAPPRDPPRPPRRPHDPQPSRYPPLLIPARSAGGAGRGPAVAAAAHAGAPAGPAAAGAGLARDPRACRRRPGRSRWARSWRRPTDWSCCPAGRSL